jgi:hypothetical protein
LAEELYARWNTVKFRQNNGLEKNGERSVGEGLFLQVRIGS